MPAPVDALLPLSLLEAVRNVDTPGAELEAEAEYAPELRNKRLGLSDTVYLQIKRFTEAARKHQRTPHDEAVALARLVGRRADADAVFRSAGRYLASQAYKTIAPVTRQAMRTLPGFVARPVALRRARRIVARFLNGSLRRVGAALVMDVPEPVTVDSAPLGIGCSYYEACLREIVRLLLGSAASVDHVRCASRGEGRCEWRTDWGAVRHTRPADAAHAA